nr:HlyD family efflux transporter periplasmic adaptor subunit [uncultured Dysosmobacter sp.]
MSEVMEKEEQLTTAPETEVQPVQEAKPSLGQKWKNLPKKKRRRIVRWLVVLVILAVLAGVLWKVFGSKSGGGKTEVMTAEVQYGSITSTVEGSGMTRAKNSEAITVTTAGTLSEVFVTEGQQVKAGDPLFTVDSPAARAAVDKARADVTGYEKQLSALQKDIAGLNLTAPHAGKIMLGEDSPRLAPGEEITKGTVVAQLNDDTKMRLEQYYSYAYAGGLHAGQKVEVSIPALMTSIPGTVEEVNMVSRITPEGSKLFSAKILVENEGALTAEMVASATVTVNGETVYPYEPGKLEYYRTTDLKSTVNGTVLSNKLVNYLQVSAGQVLVQIDGESSENEMFTIQQSLETAQEELAKAEKNLANCNAVAPIDGTVIGLTLQPGDEINTQNPIATISDTTTLTISAMLDERHVSFVKAGMPVDLNQWDNMSFGTVESVSLSSTVNNGVAQYPMTIVADNLEGKLQVNSSINYSLIASQNDNCLVLPLQAVRTVSMEDGSTLTVVYIQGERPDNAVEVPFQEEEIPEGYWPVPVEIGIQDNYNVEIKSGVEEGDVVFTQMQSANAWGSGGAMAMG